MCVEVICGSSDKLFTLPEIADLASIFPQLEIEAELADLRRVLAE
jgi:hypothetical protein